MPAKHLHCCAVHASNTEARTFLMGGDELSGAPGTKQVSLQAPCLRI